MTKPSAMRSARSGGKIRSETSWPRHLVGIPKKVMKSKTRVKHQTSPTQAVTAKTRREMATKMRSNSHPWLTSKCSRPYSSKYLLRRNRSYST